MTDPPAGWRTDVAVLELGGADVARHRDHWVIRSSRNPTFHWGNFVLVTDPAATNDADRWLAVFAAEFPAAGHVAIGLPGEPDPSIWQDRGLVVETEDVLATDRVPAQRPLPAGYTTRRLFTDDDWAQWVALDAAENQRTGEHPAEGYEEFARASARTRRGLSQRDVAAFFGAFAADRMVAGLGIVICGDLARYQSVTTAFEHRRRGLAGHLLGGAACWAHDRGVSGWVIVTEPENPAGRLYRSLGFTLDRQTHQAYRSPPS